ncbi:unnamed protein product, partial [Prorocentrum cordatum]
SWSAEQMGGFEPGEMPSGSEQVHQALSRAAAALRTGHEAAQDECPFGFLYLCTTQVLAAAVRLTGSLEGWARAVDKMMAELPFFSISASQWPTFQMLAMLSSQTKGDESAATLGSFQADIHRWGGTHPSTKRFRQFGDLRLLEPELCPLGRNVQGWTLVDQFASLSAEAAGTGRRRVLLCVVFGQRTACARSRECVWARPAELHHSGHIVVGVLEDCAGFGQIQGSGGARGPRASRRRLPEQRRRRLSRAYTASHAQ